MNHLTRAKLQTLTTAFYETYAESFDKTRQQAWNGWGAAGRHIFEKHPSSCSVVDLGCGNGRFARFLNEHQTPFSYTGLDANAQLLTQAEQTISQLRYLQTGRVKLLDLVAALKKSTLDLSAHHPVPAATVITLFGVIHHIPSFELRLTLMQLCLEQLPAGGLLILSFWQPAHAQRFKSKQLQPRAFGVDPSELEPGDMLLGWKGETHTPRYVHHTADSEIAELRAALPSHRVLDDYLADGKTNDLNRYLVLEKGSGLL